MGMHSIPMRRPCMMLLPNSAPFQPWGLFNPAHWNWMIFEVFSNLKHCMILRVWSCCLEAEFGLQWDWHWWNHWDNVLKPV